MTYARARQVTTHVDLETTETLVGVDERSFLVTHAVVTTYPAPSKRRARVQVSGPIIRPGGQVLDEMGVRELGGNSRYDVPRWLVKALGTVGVEL